MSFGNLSPDQVNKLLSMAGGQLGMSPEQLRSQLASGNLEGITSKLDSRQSSQLSETLKNPEAIKTMLGNPQIAGMLQNFLKGK